MVERLPVIGALVLAIASALAPGTAVLFARWQRTPAEWRGGVMLRGTLHGDRFEIVQQWPEHHDRVGVVFDGRLPDTVCEGVAVAIAGWWVGEHFEAAHVVADRSKYDACLEWQCFPIDERPPPCRRPRFE